MYLHQESDTSAYSMNAVINTKFNKDGGKCSDRLKTENRANL